MPANDFASYLGMPPQAPSQSMFARAADPYSADALMANVAARQQLMGMQRAAPIIQAQQAQLAYDEVAQKARDLRMKQEVEAQAERAVNELAGINPENEDFGAQARAFATRNPLAMQSPRVKQLFNLYGNQNQDFQRRSAAMAEAQNKALADMEQARIDAMEAGVPREQVFAAKSPYDIAELRSQVGGRSQRDITGQMMKEDLGLLDSSIKDMMDSGSDAIANKDGTFSPNPEFQRLVSERDRLRNDLRSFYQSKYRPVSEAPVAQTQTVVPPPVGGVAAPPPPPPSAIQNISGLPPEAIARLQMVPANELDGAIKKEEEAFNAVNEVNTAWTKAKTDLESKLKTVLPDKPNRLGINPLELFAKQVLQGVMAQGRSPRPQLLMGAGSANAAPNLVPVWQNVLEDIGVNPTQKVFTEPGKGRLKLFETLGTQDVNYAELVQDWAKRFLDQRGKLLPPSQSPTGSTLTEQQQKDLDELKAMAVSK